MRCVLSPRQASHPSQWLWPLSSSRPGCVHFPLLFPSLPHFHNPDICYLSSLESTHLLCLHIPNPTPTWCKHSLSRTTPTPWLRRPVPKFAAYGAAYDEYMGCSKMVPPCLPFHLNMRNSHLSGDSMRERGLRCAPQCFLSRWSTGLDKLFKECAGEDWLGRGGRGRG